MGGRFISSLVLSINTFCYEQIVTASADGTARIFNPVTGSCDALLIGHTSEISKVGQRLSGQETLVGFWKVPRFILYLHLCSTRLPCNAVLSLSG